MRIKFVLLSALLGAILGAGASIGAISLTLGRRGLVLAKYSYRPDPSVAFVIYLMSIVAAAFAAWFVYRHTARRRKLQATVTGALTLVLSLLIFYATALFLVQ